MAATLPIVTYTSGVSEGAFACSSLRPRTVFLVGFCADCSAVTRDCTQFGVKSGVKNASSSTAPWGRDQVGKRRAPGASASS